MVAVEVLEGPAEDGVVLDAAVEEVARQALPPGYSYEWTGQAFQEKRTGSASVFAFGFALVMVYLILSALYERWGVPFAVVLAVLSWAGYLLTQNTVVGQAAYQTLAKTGFTAAFALIFVASRSDAARVRQEESKGKATPAADDEEGKAEQIEVRVRTPDRPGGDSTLRF